MNTDIYEKYIQQAEFLIYWMANANMDILERADAWSQRIIFGQGLSILLAGVINFLAMLHTALIFTELPEISIGISLLYMISVMFLDRALTSSLGDMGIMRLFITFFLTVLTAGSLVLMVYESDLDKLSHDRSQLIQQSQGQLSEVQAEIKEAKGKVIYLQNQNADLQEKLRRELIGQGISKSHGDGIIAKTYRDEIDLNKKNLAELQGHLNSLYPQVAPLHQTLTDFPPIEIDTFQARIDTLIKFLNESTTGWFIFIIILGFCVTFDLLPFLIHMALHDNEYERLRKRAFQDTDNFLKTSLAENIRLRCRKSYDFILKAVLTMYTERAKRINSPIEEGESLGQSLKLVEKSNSPRNAKSFGLFNNPTGNPNSSSQGNGKQVVNSSPPKGSANTPATSQCTSAKSTSLAGKANSVGVSISSSSQGAPRKAVNATSQGTPTTAKKSASKGTSPKKKVAPTNQNGSKQQLVNLGKASKGA